MKEKAKKELEKYYLQINRAYRDLAYMKYANFGMDKEIKEAFINIDGLNQPNASPRYSKTKPEIKYNAKKVGVDLDDICNEFNLSKDAF